MKALTAFFIALVVTLTVMPLVIRYLKRKSRFDVPNGRSSHQMPTLRGAGIAQITGFVSSELFFRPLNSLMLVSSIGYFLIGAVDDKKSLSAASRFIPQCVLALIVMISVVEQSDANWRIQLALVSIGIVAIVAIVNATNFMDGINGITILASAVMGIGYASILWLCDLKSWALVAAALAGFSLAVSPWNLRRTARIFLMHETHLISGPLSVTANLTTLGVLRPWTG